jgi:hypothetical protein
MTKRTRAVYGTDDHANRYFRCQNCGFICDSKRDKTGDGVGYTVVQENDAYTEELNYTQLVNSGCPFCGCKNYK